MPWAYDFNFLSLCFSSCEMGIINLALKVAGLSGTLIFFFPPGLHLPVFCKTDYHACFSSKKGDFQAFEQPT